MSKKVWNLMYRVGNTQIITGDSGNPSSKQVALDGAATVTENGWRVWVEHHTSGKILYQNPAEIEYQKAIVCKQILEFAKANVPGFAKSR